MSTTVEDHHKAIKHLSEEEQSLLGQIRMLNDRLAEVRRLKDKNYQAIVNGITYRSANVVYEFKQPLASRGKKIFYIGKQAVYQFKAPTNE